MKRRERERERVRGEKESGWRREIKNEEEEERTTGVE